MRKTGFLYDERFLLHCTSPGHPEAPGRVECAYKGIVEGGLLDNLILVNAVRAEERWVEAAHHPEYMNRFKEACCCGWSEFGHPDNQMCEETFEVAMLAVGGILEMAKLLMTGEIDNGFCCVRPPGHHAEADRALGFCYFNNIAIAAKYLQAEWGVKRVGIIDFDVHHGNGTQSIFECDPSVFYYSIHEHPSFSFPGTGREFEKGSEEGYGYTLNVPVLPGQRDQGYQSLFEKSLLPAFEAFSPEVILVSAGFDAHEDDDMSDLKLSTECFSWIMARIVGLADAYSSGRLISIMEGGYCLKRLPELARNHVEVLLDIYDPMTSMGF